MMNIKELFQNEDYPEIYIEDVMDDSRVISPNSIFFSKQGLTHDGHSFINQAIDHGAICIVHSRELKNEKEDAYYVHDPKLNENYPTYINRFFDYPSTKLDVIGITGTNGKTTIAVIIQYLMNHFKKSAYMGTLGFYYDELEVDSKLTTSSLADNQRFLSHIVKKDVRVCSLEASSQGIDLGRLDGIEFKSLIFTNLTQDHLDYHLNMESYYLAKRKLFSQHDPSKKAIINIDDEYGLRLSKEIVNPVITCSMNNPEADAYIYDIDMSFDKVKFKLKYDDKIHKLETNLLGQYNIMNLTQAMIACVLEGISIEALTPLITGIPNIDGRMEIISSEFGFNVIVDYAHSPDSMVKILEFAKTMVKDDGRIISVFGSAGQRDKSKRKLMGEVADQYSDLIYITEDDPRDEKVGDIALEIAQGIFDHPYVIIESRAQAIHFAIQTARANDIIVMMGKGSETMMAVGHHEIPYEGDIQIVNNSLEELRKEYEYERK